MSSLHVNSLDKAPLSMLLREFAQKLMELIQTQIELIRTEVSTESRKLAAALLCGVIAFIFGILTITFLGVSLILLLMPLLGVAWASVVTTVVYLAMTGLAVFLARRELGKSNPSGDIQP